MREHPRWVFARVLALAAVIVALVVVPVSETADAAPAWKTRAVPARIASDCSVDVTGPLTSWIRSVPKRTRIHFAKDGCYRIDGTVSVPGLRRVVLEGNGATLKATTLGDQGRRHVTFNGCKDLTVRNLTVRGVKPVGARYSAPRAFQHGLSIIGVDGIRLTNVSVFDVYGDFVYIGSAGRGGAWSEHVRIDNSRFEGSGRQGISITAGRDIVIERNRIADVGRSMFDIEPNAATGGAVKVRVRHNETGRARNFWLANGGAGTKVRDIVFADNVMVEPTGGVVWVYGPATGYRGPYVFERNTLFATDGVHDEGSRGAFFFSRASGVTIRRNRVTFPVKESVPAVELRDALDVVVRGNDFVNAGQTVLETTRSKPASPPTAGTPTTTVLERPVGP